MTAVRHLVRGGARLLAVPIVVAAAAGTPVYAQALTVLPVTVTLQPRQMAAVLTLVNQGEIDSTVQVRAFAWSQTADGVDQLVPSDAIAVSPPLGTIAAGRKQVIRLVLRRPPQDREISYRILVDQIPGPAQPNEVRVALRLSLPVFAEPAVRAIPDLRFSTEMVGDRLYLIAFNDGKRHDTVREIALRTTRGETLKPEAGSSPYVLPGIARRWRIAAGGPLPQSGETLQLTAAAEQLGVVQRSLTIATPH